MEEKIKFKLFQVVDVKTKDLTYPCCFNCYKKVFYVTGLKKFIKLIKFDFYLINDNRWNCSSCNEDFLKIMHRFKLIIGIYDQISYRICSGFGKSVEILFGEEANTFYKNKKIFEESNERWNDLIENALRYCLLGRWFLFDLKLIKKKEGLSTYLIKNVSLPNHEKENFISINAYFKNRNFSIDQSDFKDPLCVEENNFSIINETIVDDKYHEGENICKLLENFTFLK